MRAFILAIVFFTGLSGLVFQVVWQKYLSLWVGGEALSAALVVSIFLGGLSLGYYIFGRTGKNLSAQQLTFRAGVIEICIGAWSFFFPTLFDLAWNNRGAFPHAEPWKMVTDILLSVVLLSPATILMGSTLPLLTRGLSRLRNELSQIHARVYGLNTFGAFVGVLFGGFFMIQWLGLPMSLMYLSIVNIVGGLLMLVLSHHLGDEGLEKTIAEKSEKASKSGPALKSARAKTIRQDQSNLLLYAVSFFTGLTSIGFEILFMRLVSISIGTSEYSYSVVVGIFILMLALGALSLATPVAKGSTRRLNLIFNQVLLILGLLAVYWTVPYWGYFGYLLRQMLSNAAPNFYFYNFLIFSLFALIMSVPVFFMGRTLPMLFNDMQSTLKGSALDVGRIYSINTFGSAVGGMFMGYFLLLKFNADTVYKVGIVFAVFTLFLLILRNRQATHFAAKTAMVVILFVAAISLPHWSKEQLTTGLFRAKYPIANAFKGPSYVFANQWKDRKLLFYRDDPNTTVAVVDFGPMRSLRVNGKSDGMSAGVDLLTALLAGYLSAMFTTVDQGEAAVIGFGLGPTARAVAEAPNVSKVTVFEISKSVIEAESYFRNVNKDVIHNPKVSVQQMDAFRGLMGFDKQLSIVISEPSNPWISGIDRLFSLEFYETVRRKLHPDGVFLQWIHTYEQSADTLAMVMNTFTQVFPEVHIFENETDWLILGSVKKWDATRIEHARQMFERMNLKATLAPLSIPTFTQLALRNRAFPVELTRESGVHSLFYPKLSYRAARDFFFSEEFSFDKLIGARPSFRVHSRETFHESLIGHLHRTGRVTSEEVLSACTAKPIAGMTRPQFTVASNFSQMSDTCRSWLMYFAAEGKLNLPANLPRAQQFAKRMKSLETRKGSWLAGLGPQDAVDLMGYLPEWMPAPPEQDVLLIFNGCSRAPGLTDEDRKHCVLSWLRNALILNQVDLAKRVFAKLPEGYAPTETHKAFQDSVSEIEILKTSRAGRQTVE